MRVLITNPDTIGDVLLRQPMFAALREAGHELMLMARPLVLPLLGQIAPGARVTPIAVNVYDPSLPWDAAWLDPYVDAARGFNPELIVVAPYQWTLLEERLAAGLPGARVVAMNGKRFGDPKWAPSPPPSLPAGAGIDVAEETPELIKNQRLASAALGREVALPDPRLEATSAQLRAADAELARLGLEPGSYWAAVVGDDRNSAVRNWRTDRWSSAFSSWSAGDRRFLFVGIESERDTARVVVSGMGESRERAFEWFGDGAGALDTLVGLIARSRGYVGRDTGPMHVAAALGKPVLAVFGGGTWPRFLPAVNPSVSITVGVPCMGCGWVCHLNESYCVKDVPVKDVVSAFEALEGGRVEGRTTKVITPGPPMLTKIGREGAIASRRHLAEVSLLGRELKKRERESASESAAVTAAVDRAMKELTQANARATKAENEHAHARGQIDVLHKRVQELSAEVSAERRSAAQQSAEASTTKDRLIEARARMGDLESRLQKASSSISDAAKERLAAQDAELAAVRQELARCRESLAASASELAAARARAAEEHVSLRAKDGEIRDQLARTHARLTAIDAENADLKLRLARHDSDRAALGTLSRQQESEIHVLRAKLDDLLRSRWRKLGVRIGVAKTPEWLSPNDRNGSGA